MRLQDLFKIGID